MGDAVKVSSKYQVVIPPDLRKSLGIKPGDDVAWIEDEFGLRLVRVPSLDDIRGIFANIPTGPFERDKEYG